MPDAQPIQPIRFFHRGAQVDVRGVHPTRTVLDWLREDAHCTGTKEGCNEGDCGACTVVIGELATAADGLTNADATAAAHAAANPGNLRLRTVNACIQFLPTLHGKALFTVEDLKAQAAAAAAGLAAAAWPAPSGSASAAIAAADDPRDACHTLHPVQQAMVDCHGSQCGFCTPGFVMSLWSTYQAHQASGTRPTRQQLADDLSGNLCRCTGYRPILDAGQRMFELPPLALNEAPVVAALAALARGDTGDGRRHGEGDGRGDDRGDSRGGDTGGADDAAAPATDRDDSVFSYAAPNPQVVDAAGLPRIDHFHAPRTLAALAALREAHPAATLLAGCTDIGLWTNKQFRDLGDIVYVGDVAALKTIEVRGGAPAGGGAGAGAGGGGGDGAIAAHDIATATPPSHRPAPLDTPTGAAELFIGAGASLEAAFGALAQRLPALTDVWLRFASPPIRNAGTMGGSVANGSPIGDSAPLLMALDARIELRRGDRVRRLPLADFYVGYMRNRLEPGEFVQGLAVPLAALTPDVRAYKISKRFDCDISALCAGLALERGDDHAVSVVRIAFGGMAATVKRAANAEAALMGRPWTQASVDAAKAALADDFAPLSDMRASAGYRLRVAQNLLQRFWLETRAIEPLTARDTSVWSVMPHAVGPPAAAAATVGRIDLHAV